MEEDGGDEKGARSMEVTMSIYGITVDESRGFDVMRGAKILRHFASYAEATAYAAEGAGRYVRYWGVKPQKEGK